MLTGPHGRVQRSAAPRSAAAGAEVPAEVPAGGEGDPGWPASWESMQLATQPIQHQSIPHQPIQHQALQTQPVLRPIPQSILQAIPPRSTWPTARPRTFLSRVRAWMVVLPCDALMLVAPVLWNPGQVRAMICFALLSVLLFTGGSRYRARLHLSVLDELPALVTKVLTAAAVVATVIALRHDQVAVTAFLGYAAISLGLVVAGRVVTTGLISWSRRRRTTAHPTVLVGGGALAAELAQILRRSPRYGLEPVGFVDDGSNFVAQAVLPQLGELADLEAVVGRGGADVVLVADGDFSERTLLDVVRGPATSRCDLLVVPRLHHFAIQTGSGDHIGSIPVTRIRTPNLHGPAVAVKRAFDILVAGGLLVLTAPLIAVCALAARIEGGPGVIFRQERVGRDGAIFECLKIRSLRPVDEADSATTWSVATDDRVGPVGRFLRRTSLDELPQLWNIVRGDMTLVGPRPERPHFVHQFSAQYDRYEHRHRVKAGLTGLAQVSGLRGDTSIADRARFDNYYIEHWSLWLDVKIILRTFAELLFARGL
jgi:exopolysaccharide biosynthesis polyprenyl glycosylphosphotransferase